MRAQGEDVLLIMVDPYIYRRPPSFPSAMKVAWRQSKRVLGEIWSTPQPVSAKLRDTGRWAGRQGRRPWEAIGTKLRGRRDTKPTFEVPLWVPAASRP